MQGTFALGRESSREGIAVAKIFLSALLLVCVPLTHAQQGQTFTWSSTKCSDGTATGWPGCTSEIVPSGSYYSQAVSGLFAEKIDGRTANVGVTVTKINTNFVVHVYFYPTLGGTFIVQPQDAVWIESNSGIRTTIHSTSYPDKEIQAHKDADVMKYQFKSKNPVTVGTSGASGYLFFPYDSGATNITIVVQVASETFRFPFAKNPNLSEWLDPDKIPATLSTPVQQAPLTAGESTPYQTGKLVDFRRASTGAGAGRAQGFFCLAVGIGDMTYLARYEGTWRWSYEPTDFVVGDPVEVRIKGNDLYLKKSKGGDLKTSITRRERNAPDKKSLTCALPVQDQR
jgi:hypothetical protein